MLHTTYIICIMLYSLLSRRMQTWLWSHVAIIICTSVRYCTRHEYSIKYYTIIGPGALLAQVYIPQSRIRADSVQEQARERWMVLRIVDSLEAWSSFQLQFSFFASHRALAAVRLRGIERVCMFRDSVRMLLLFLMMRSFVNKWLTFRKTPFPLTAYKGGVSEYRPNATVVVAPSTSLTIFCSTIELISWNHNGAPVRDNWASNDGIQPIKRNYSNTGGVEWYSDTIEMKAIPHNNNTKVECLGHSNLESIGTTTLIIAGCHACLFN